MEDAEVTSCNIFLQDSFLNYKIQSCLVASTFKASLNSVCFLFFLFLSLIAFVIDTFGTPEYVQVTCGRPQGFPSIWHYGIWKHHEPWLNQDKLTRCVDPRLCMDKIPHVPLDGTVKANFNRFGFDNMAGSSYTYECAYKSKSLLSSNKHIT